MIDRRSGTDRSNVVRYTFEDFSVRIAERELWRGDTLLPVNRYVFDTIAWLIEHRDRAVGRDELVAAVWGRADVTEGHLNQVIARARRALGDDAQAQRMIRTAPGFGYRWVGEVAAVDTERSAPPADAAPALASPDAAESKPPASPRSHRRAWVLATALLVSLGGAVAVHWWPQDGGAARDAAAAANALVVLPIAVRADADANWLELGAMDLIAERLRGAGLRVSPSKTVVTALYGADSPVAPTDHARVRAVLGAGLIVQGVVASAGERWTVELAALGADGASRRVQAREADPIRAAAVAADLLAAALGRRPAGDDAGSDAVQRRLQQAQAASLTNQLELARTILNDLPESARTLPDVRLRLADLDFRAGRHAQAAEAVERLLADPAIGGAPIPRGRALTLRGNLKFRRSDFAGAVADLDAAVGVLEHVPAPLDLADALTRRGLARAALFDLDGGASDYSRARLIAEQAGDPLRVAHVEAGFGLLQIDRKRLDLALPYLDTAMTQYEALGVVERVVTLRLVLNDAYAGLLRWPEVANLSDRQWALRERIGDPGLALTVVNRRVRLLIALGRFREAGEVVGDARERYGGLRPESLRYLYDMQADLAWHEGRMADVVRAVDAALEKWPRDPSYDRYAYLILLRQRALSALGQATDAKIAPWLPERDEGLSSVFWIARAEWASHGGDDTAARRDFERALSIAEDAGTPALVLFAAQAYVDWLLPRGERAKAAELAGRVGVWTRDDYDCALLRARVFHALGNHDNWRLALDAARTLAGERAIPAALTAAPAAP
jgi:DNA-binding winged helix-turn-helix (wHTH) protein/tetratricopeptide (TPR) repeat protein